MMVELQLIRVYYQPKKPFNGKSQKRKSNWDCMDKFWIAMVAYRKISTNISEISEGIYVSSHFKKQS